MKSRTPRLLRRLCVTGAALLAVGPLLPPSAAVATVDPAASAFSRSVERHGLCRRGPGEWDLKVETRPGARLFLEFDVDKIATGSRWQLFVVHNGRRIAAVTRVAGTSSGVRVRRLTHNRRGRDRFRAAAVNPHNGSTCVARLRF